MLFLSRLALPCAAACLLSVPTSAPAAVFEDTFDTAGATRNDDLNDPADVAWYALNGATNPALSVVTDAELNSGALNVDNTSTFVKVIAPFSATLGAVGSGTETLRVSFDFRLAAAANPAVSGGFRFGFFSSNGTPLTADGVSNSTNDFGYGAQIGTGTASMTILKEPSNSGGISGGGQNDSAITTAGATTVNIVDTARHSATFEMSRTATGLAFSVSVDGALKATAVDNSALGFTYDELIIGTGNTNFDYLLDNVRLETVPEPAAIGLLGLAAGAGLLRRRQHQAR